MFDASPLRASSVGTRSAARTGLRHLHGEPGRDEAAFVEDADVEVFGGAWHLDGDPKRASRLGGVWQGNVADDRAIVLIHHEVGRAAAVRDFRNSAGYRDLD